MTVYQPKSDVECSPIVRRCLGLLFHNYRHWLPVGEMKDLLDAAFYEVWEPKVSEAAKPDAGL